MKKVFISLSMKGKPNEEISATFEFIKSNLEKEANTPTSAFYNLLHGDSFTVLDSIMTLTDVPVANERVYYLGKSLKILADADILVVANADYVNYDGCYIEHETARRYNIPIYYLNIL